jgi:uncharacterized membrane protein YdjX (TVP38/TMEM64 family)
MSEKSGTPWSRIILRVVLVGLALAVFVFALLWVKRSGLMQQALNWIGGLGPWAPVAFIAIYVASVVCLAPASILTFGAGFVFRMTWGSLYVLVAANIAANICFLLGRHLARDWIAHRMEAQPKFRAIDEAVARDGWKIAALVRLAPIFPFSVMSYAFGLTRIPFWHYALANITMIPGTLMYVYFGTVARDLTDKPATPPWVKWTVGALTVIVILYMTRFAKRALRQKIS